MTFTPLILTHVFAALGAIILGGITLWLRKGTTLHRWLGRLWAACMMITALVSFGIRRGGEFSWIHLLSIWVIVALGIAVYAAIRGNLSAHRRWIISTYSSLVVAGLFTVLPGRRLGYLLWHSIGLV